MDALYTQQKALFDAWFEGVKNQLGTDAAGNLQNQINVLKPKVDAVNNALTFSGQNTTTKGRLDVIGETRIKGKLILGKDNDFMITKTFTTNVTGLQGNQATYAYVPYTIPDGYVLVDFYDASTNSWHGCTIRSEDKSRKTVTIYVQNLSNRDATPAATVYLKGLFIRKETI